MFIDKPQPNNFWEPHLWATQNRFASYVSEIDMNPHYKERRHKPTLAPWLLLAIAITVGTVGALPPQGTREIVSDDFTKNRPEAKSTDPKEPHGQSPSGATAKPKPHRTYRLASQPIKKPGPPRQKGQPPIENAVAQLRITTWRLRPVKVTASHAMAPIR